MYIFITYFSKMIKLPHANYNFNVLTKKSINQWNQNNRCHINWLTLRSNGMIRCSFTIISIALEEVSIRTLTLTPPMNAQCHNQLVISHHFSKVHNLTMHLSFSAWFVASWTKERKPKLSCEMMFHTKIFLLVKAK